MTELAERRPIAAHAPEELAAITDVAIRNGFVRKVFSILGFQLLLTTAIAAGVVNYGDALIKKNPSLVVFLLTLSAAVTVGMSCIMFCCSDMMRKSPTNYIILVVFTVAEAFLVGFIAVQYTAQSVLVTFAITAGIVLMLTLFACQTKYDFTGFLPYFFMASLCLLGLGFALSLASWLGASQNGAFRTMYLVYAAFGALLFSGYIILDTQMIIGGKHAKFRFCIDDYCFAAIHIYLDIVNLFIFLLQLFGERRR